MPDKNICTTAALAGIEKGPAPPKEEDQDPKINTDIVYQENEGMSNKEE